MSRETQNRLPERRTGRTDRRQQTTRELAEQLGISVRQLYRVRAACEAGKRSDAGRELILKYLLLRSSDPAAVTIVGMFLNDLIDTVLAEIDTIEPDMLDARWGSQIGGLAAQQLRACAQRRQQRLNDPY